MLVKIKENERDIHGKLLPLFLRDELFEVIRQDDVTTKVVAKKYSYTFRNSAILKEPSER